MYRFFFFRTISISVHYQWMVSRISQILSTRWWELSPFRNLNLEAWVCLFPSQGLYVFDELPGRAFCFPLEFETDDVPYNNTCLPKFNQFHCWVFIMGCLSDTIVLWIAKYCFLFLIFMPGYVSATLWSILLFCRFVMGFWNWDVQGSFDIKKVFFKYISYKTFLMLFCSIL